MTRKSASAISSIRSSPRFSLSAEWKTHVSDTTCPDMPSTLPDSACHLCNAGSTRHLRYRNFNLGDEDYPRAHGETWHGSSRSLALRGLSPRSRGNPDVITPTRETKGTIPTLTGKPLHSNALNY